MPAQANGNVTKGLVAIIDGNNNVAYAENVVTGLVGVDDLVVVTTNTAVLVTKRGSGEDVKTLLAAINQQAFAIEEQSLEPKAANVITLASEADHALYQIHLAPGQQLSRRAASIGKTHWTILSGHATLRLANTEVTLESGQFLQGEPDQIYIIGNLSAFEVKMLESQTWLADSSPPNLR